MTARDLDATHAAAVAAERHADLRTRFALALTSGALSHGKLLARDRITGNPIAYTPDTAAAGFVPRLYDLADALATEDARRREADGVQ